MCGARARARAHTHIHTHIYIYAYRVWWRSLKERDDVEDVGIDESMILKCTLKKLDKREWTDLIYVA
jgi:hypothetical protein